MNAKLRSMYLGLQAVEKNRGRLSKGEARPDLWFGRTRLEIWGWDKRNKLQREKFKATALDRGQDFVGLT